MKPEGSTYAGARSDYRIPGKAEFEHVIKLVAIKKKVFIKKTQHTPDKKCEEAAKARPSQAMVAALFQGRQKVVAVKARREGSHLTSAKLCKASGDEEEMV